MFVFHHYQIKQKVYGVSNLDENKNYNDHVEYITNRNRDLDRFIKLKNMIFDNYEN